MASTEHQPLQTALTAALADRLGESRFRLWFGEGVNLVLQGDGEALEVQVPNAFFREWIQGHFSKNLIDVVESVTGRRVRLTFAIHDEAHSPLPRLACTTDAGTLPEPSDGTGTVPPLIRSPNHAIHPTAPPRGTRPSHDLRRADVQAPGQRRRELKDFIIGSANQLAHAAAEEMIRTAGGSFNPLFIHGGIGLGKTYLLTAIAQGLRTSHPGINVLWLTAEAFTNSFLEAMRAGALTTFRSRYRRAGAFAVDDVHFFAGTRATQSEFLHTFDALLERGAPIILTARQHPRQITRLNEELVTRFGGGMVVKLDPPDHATRREILQLTCKAKGVTIPSPVLDYIAENIRSSVRELEGALNTVLAYTSLTGTQLDPTLARSVLQDITRPITSAVGLLEIEKAVCALFKIDSQSLKSESRARVVAYPRMLAMYLARKHTPNSFGAIGTHFGGRNHATVIAAEKKIEQWLREEERFNLLPGFNTIAEVIAEVEKVLRL